MPKNKILIIDEEQEIVNTLALMLRARDYAVSYAVDGQEGLEKAKNEQPNLILLDVMMLGLDGYKVCMSLKSDRDTKNIPVVIISARVERDALVRCHGLGINDFIAKPFNLPTLLGKLGKYMRR